MNFKSLETNFTVLNDNTLSTVYGGRYSVKFDINIVAHKVIDSIGRLYGGIYKAGQSGGYNWYMGNR